tara:strand:+ start:242 stop:451 length:210 start_codon:yes stop_codon:yes gene_type:complete
MKTLSILSLLLLLTNCAGSNMAGSTIKFGARCTASDEKQLQEKSYVWFVSKEAVKDFDKRINKANCLNS